MAVIKLAPGATERVPPGTLTLRWQTKVLAQEAVVLSIERTDAPGSPAPAAQQQGPSTWLLAALPVAATVVVRPVAGGAFPDGVVIDLQLTLSLSGAGGDNYILPSTDVSGTTQQPLLVLTPSGGAIDLAVPLGGVRTSPRPPHVDVRPAVRALAGDTPPPPPPATGLTPLAQSAVYRARALAGPEGRLADGMRTELHVAVDRSASMLPYVRAGARQALLEVLAGLNEVAGTASEVPVWQLGTVPERVHPGLSSHTVAAYDEQLGSLALTTGTVVAPLVAKTAQILVPRTVIVLTDGVPADLDDLALALGAAAGAQNKTRWHLLVLARSKSDQAVKSEPWRDELSGLERHLGPLLTVSSVTPATGMGWLAQRLSSTEELSELLLGLGLLGPVV